jgi:MFS family permease
MTDTTTTASTSELPPAPPPLAAEPGVVIAQTERFLDRCQDLGSHPDEVARQLVRAGWEPATAGLVAERYRGRFDEHRLGYAGFLFAVGFSALALGSIGHLLLADADGHEPSADALALWLTVLAIAVPFGVWSWLWVRRIDDTDPVAAWSRPRQSLARTLLWCCGIVGGFRLLHYVFALIASLTGSSWATELDPLIGLANVAVTAGITVPLGVWAFRFLHRFDAA